MRRDPLFRRGRDARQLCLPLRAVPQLVGACLGVCHGPEGGAEPHRRAQVVPLLRPRGARLLPELRNLAVLARGRGAPRLDRDGDGRRATGLQLERHIYVDFKGDYYDIADGLPQEDSA